MSLKMPDLKWESHLPGASELMHYVCHKNIMGISLWRSQNHTLVPQTARFWLYVEYTENYQPLDSNGMPSKEIKSSIELIQWLIYI